MDQLYRGFLICEKTYHFYKPLLVSFLFPVDGVCQRTGRVTTDEEGRWLWGLSVAWAGGFPRGMVFC